MNAQLSKSNTSNLRRSSESKASWCGQMAALRSRMKVAASVLAISVRMLITPRDHSRLIFSIIVPLTSEGVRPPIPELAALIPFASLRRCINHCDSTVVYETHSQANQRTLRWIKMPSLGSKGCGDEASTQASGSHQHRRLDPKLSGSNSDGRRRMRGNCEVKASDKSVTQRSRPRESCCGEVVWQLYAVGLSLWLSLQRELRGHWLWSSDTYCDNAPCETIYGEATRNTHPAITTIHLRRPMRHL
jgi:hypothetical protein